VSYNLPKTILGRTGLEVTRLGVGGAYCDSVEGYRAALDCGVTYVDTARVYRDGADEEVIGRAIKGRRDDLVLATKTGKRDGAEARKELETSLKLLGTDYVDIYQIHHLNTQPEREQALGPDGALEAIQKARDEGLVSFIGVTGHDWVQVAAAVATGEFDTFLCWYNCAMKEPETTVFPAADAHDTGGVIMNATRNDRLFSESGKPSPEQFYRYVLSHESVDVTIAGLRNVDLFCQMASKLSERDELAPEEMTEMEAYGREMRASGKWK